MHSHAAFGGDDQSFARKKGWTVLISMASPADLAGRQRPGMDYLKKDAAARFSAILAALARDG
jgi:hypothetical protein